MPGSDSAAMLLLLVVLLIPMVGVLMALPPFLMRRGEVFAVTVPTAAQDDPFVKSLKRRYAAMVGAATAVLTAAGVACALARNEQGIVWIMVGGSLVLCVGGYALMLRYRAKMQAHKRAQGWVAEAQEAVAVVGEQPVPRAVSLKWSWLYVPIMLVTAAIGIVGYDSMPDMVPMQMGFDGTVSRWEPKGPGIVAFPVIIQVFLTACIMFGHWSILKSKKWAEPGAPATSALAYGLFARAQSIFLVATGVLLSACIGLTFQLSSLGMMTLGQAGFVMVAVGAVPVVVGSIVLGVVYGQAGSRVFRRMQGSDRLLADDDEHWKLGIFYCNPDDPSLFLPERFGIGWTVNLARPAVWLMIAAGVALTAAFVVVVALLV